MNPLLFDLTSEAYYPPTYSGSISLRSVILVYTDVVNAKMKLNLPYDGMVSLIVKQLSIGSRYYKVVIAYYRTGLIGTIESFRVGGYLPYVMKADYAFYDDNLNDQYFSGLSQFESTRINNELIDCVNCLIVYGYDLNAITEVVTTRLVTTSDVLYTNTESDLVQFNRLIHKIVVFNFDCHHLTSEAVRLLTRPSCRQYGDITFPDDTKFIFLTVSSTVFDDDLNSVGQKFRVIQVRTPSVIAHEFRVLS